MSAGQQGPSRTRAASIVTSRRMGSASSPRTGRGCAPPGFMDEFSSPPSWERLLAAGPGASAF